MMTRTRLMCLTVLLASSAALGGQWLSPDWPTPAPRFQPVPLNWETISAAPCLYRLVVDVPAGVDRATALLRTTDYVYVYVDGKAIYNWAPVARSRDNPGTPADPARVHELDLSEQLTPGEHVLVISAPGAVRRGGRATTAPAETAAGGFILDGGLYKGTQRVAPLASDANWTVTMFRPTEIVQDSSIMMLAYGGKAVENVCSDAVKVKAVGEAWTASEDALAAAYYNAAVQRARRDLEDAKWRFDLLAGKGIYIADREAFGWAGPGRLGADVLKAAIEGQKRYAALDSRVKAAEAERVAAADALVKALGDLHKLMGDAAAEAAAAERASQAQRTADNARALALAGNVVPVRFVKAPTEAERRQAIQSSLDHTLNVLNESRYDRLGWLPLPELADNQVGNWGVRINPVAPGTEARFNPRWRFQTDPQDQGIAEQRHTIGYNIEGQWPQIDGRQSWTRNARFAEYKGVAWYRQAVFVPAEWAGNPVEFRFRVAGEMRIWINDQEVTALGRGDAQKTFTVPADKLTYGGRNFVALRIKAEGNNRGLTGPADVTCPSLDAAAAATPRVDVLASALSPCAVLTPQTDTLQFHHAGKISLLLPPGGRAESYDAARDGKLKANWALLWLTPTSPAGVERPILLVFQHNPVGISCQDNLTRIKFAKSGERVIAVRPYAKLATDKIKPGAELQRTIGLWSRAALAVPLNYMSITKVIRPGEPWEDLSIDHMVKGPLLGQTMVYDYMLTEDEWGTEPLKLAPLPALCSMAIDTKFRTLQLDEADKVAVLQDGGLASPYRAITGAEKIGYRYEVEPWPRLAGFTSWMFANGDTGVPGNRRELELIAAAGANSYRPQHNFSDEPAVGVQGKTRVQAIVEDCNRVGVNYTNNIDERLGGTEQFVMNQYDEFIEKVCQHYEKIARQIGDRPFWAVGYDLINEGFHHQAVNYNPAMKKLTARVRAIDKRHLCYVEPCESWSAIQKLQVIEPTGDPLTMYSFHDYNFRLKAAGDRWPTLENDITSICRMWWPAFEFQIKHSVGMHCGEYGGFAATSNESLAQFTLLGDFFKIFDQAGMHQHYYPGREIFNRQADGSVAVTNVVRAHREYFRRPGFNQYYKMWAEAPKAPGRVEQSH